MNAAIELQNIEQKSMCSLPQQAVMRKRYVRMCRLRQHLRVWRVHAYGVDKNILTTDYDKEQLEGRSHDGEA